MFLAGTDILQDLCRKVKMKRKFVLLIAMFFAMAFSFADANTVAFFKYEVKASEQNDDGSLSDKANARLEKAEKKRKSYEFNSLEDFEKLLKKHKGQCLSITIPENSKLRNVEELKKLSNCIFDDSSIILRKLFPKDAIYSGKNIGYSENSVHDDLNTILNKIPEVAESPICVDCIILNDAGKKDYIFIIFCEGLEILLQQEKERDANEAAGFGRFTDDELVAMRTEAERDANEKAGFGRLTDKEVEAERQQNARAGRGRVTNAEINKNKQLVKQYVKQAKAYEQKKQWAFALNSYYEAMAVNTDVSLKKEAVEGYAALASAILNGNPGLGKYDPFSMPDEWQKLLVDAEKCAYTFNPISICFLKDGVKLKELNYNTRTATYTVSWWCRYSYHFDRVIGVIHEGYKKAYRNEWDLPRPSVWPLLSISGNYAFNYPYERYWVDNNGKEPGDINALLACTKCITSKRYNYNSFAIHTIDFDSLDYINGRNSDISLFGFEFAFFDNNGKQVSQSYRVQPKEMFNDITHPGLKRDVSGIPSETMNLIENGKAKPCVTRVYIKYGYGEYKTARYDWYDGMVKKWKNSEYNAFVLDVVKLGTDGSKTEEVNYDKLDAFLSKLKELNLPLEKPDSARNVNNAFETLLSNSGFTLTRNNIEFY